MAPRRVIARGASRDPSHQETTQVTQRAFDDPQARIQALQEENRTLSRINERFSVEETRLHEVNQLLRSENVHLHSKIARLESETRELEKKSNDAAQSRQKRETSHPMLPPITSLPFVVEATPRVRPREGIKREDSDAGGGITIGTPSPTPNLPQVTIDTAHRPLRSTGLRAPRRKEPSRYAESPPPGHCKTEEDRRGDDANDDDAYDQDVQNMIMEFRRSERLRFRSGGTDGREDTAERGMDHMFEREDEDTPMTDAAGGDYDDLYEPPSEDEEDADILHERYRSREPAPSPGTHGSRSRMAFPSSSQTGSATARSTGAVGNSKKRKQPGTYAGDGEADDEETAPTSNKKPRYSRPRQTKDRFAIGTLENGPVGFKFVKMARTTKGVWKAWHEGAEDNPPLVDLENTYGVGWRNAPGEMGYASDYVTKRRLIVQGIEKWARRHRISNEQMMETLDERAKGRVVTELLDVLRRPEETDPLEAIKPKGR